MSDNSLTNTLVDELRAAVNSGKGNYGHRLLCGNAAEEIERLQKLNTALLDATEGCVNCSVKLHQWMRAGGVTAPEPVSPPTGAVTWDMPKDQVQPLWSHGNQCACADCCAWRRGESPLKSGGGL